MTIHERVETKNRRLSPASVDIITFPHSHTTQRTILPAEQDVYNTIMEGSIPDIQPTEITTAPETLGQAVFRKVIFVSNRLPAKIENGPDGQELKLTIGGLGHALHAYAEGMEAKKRARGEDVHVDDPEYMWLGWHGSTTADNVEGLEESFATLSANGKIPMKGITLTPEQEEGYYNSIANNTLWMLFHNKLRIDARTGEPMYYKFKPEDYLVYRDVNRDVFAERVAQAVEGDNPGEDLIWIHDYHLMLTARELRDRGIQQKMGFFLHIPFPEPQVFSKISETPVKLDDGTTIDVGQDIIDGLLAHNIVGFQTPRFAHNFLDTVHRYFPDAQIERNEKGGVVTLPDNRQITVGTYPISIDPRHIEEEMQDPDMKRKVEKLNSVYGEDLITGEDRIWLLDGSRLDPTKGILQEMKAFRLFLRQNPHYAGKVHFVRVVSPSRENVQAYKDLKAEMYKLYHEINQEFRQHGKAIKLFDHGVPYKTFKAFLASADIGFIATEADGQNLVTKEAAVAGREDMGIIIGSGAGAAVELKDAAIIVDVTDEEEGSAEEQAMLQKMADAIKHVVEMPREERVARKLTALEVIYQNDVDNFVDTFLEDATTAA
jgi:trehalose 6-phosphate synthase